MILRFAQRKPRSRELPDARIERYRQHPRRFLRALRLLLHDLLSRFVFAGLYALTYGVAVAVGIAAGAVGIGWARTRRGRVAGMQWLSLFLAVVFGGTMLLTGNPAFAMPKPGLVYGAVAIVLLSPGWMNHYAPTMACGVDLSGLDLVFGLVGQPCSVLLPQPA